MRVGVSMPAMHPPPTLQQRLAERVRPEGAVIMHQRWEHLLFLHWRWDASAVQDSLPGGLTVDTFDGSAWIGLVPLFMRNVRPRFVPAIPAMSDFLELNLRTYVHDSAGRPGLYFYSLDCDQPVAVEAAKRLLNLRYEHADMTSAVDADGWVELSAQRNGWHERANFRYHCFGPEPGEAEPDSLEFFLIERYRLFASDLAGDQLTSIRVCHPPYRIQQAQVFEWGDAPLHQAGFLTGGRAPDHICCAEPQDVDVFTPEVLAPPKPNF